MLPMDLRLPSRFRRGGRFTANPFDGVAPLTVQFTSPKCKRRRQYHHALELVVRRRRHQHGSEPRSHIYTNAGTFQPILMMTNVLGTTVYGSGPAIIISSLGVTFTASPNYGVAPLTVQFTCPNVDNGGNTITRWNWNFGDGGTSTMQNPSHTYLANGDFTDAAGHQRPRRICPCQRPGDNLRYVQLRHRDQRRFQDR